MLILFDFGFNFNYRVMEIHFKLISGHEEKQFSDYDLTVRTSLYPGRKIKSAMFYSW